MTIMKDCLRQLIAYINRSIIIIYTLFLIYLTELKA